MLLAGDIGGTKTTVALFSLERGGRRLVHEPVRQATYASGAYDGLEPIIADFLQGTAGRPVSASFGVAGPVVGDRAKITNLSWTIDAAALSQAFSLPVTLLNDLEAIASAVPFLEAEDVVTLSAGEPVAGGAIGVIAPGTGLGEAFLVWGDDRYRAYPSEGGHTAFAPTSAKQLDMLNYFLERMDHVSYERLCSGSGIPNLYAYLRERGTLEEAEWLRRELDGAHDMTPIIIGHAMTGDAEICSATLALFMEILGDEAGNLALTVLATGGIYLGGGIPPRILPELQHSRFLHLFRRKGRFSNIMKRMPVHVITDPSVALRGAAYGTLMRDGDG